MSSLFSFVEVDASPAIVHQTTHMIWPGPPGISRFAVVGLSLALKETGEIRFADEGYLRVAADPGTKNYADIVGEAEAAAKPKRSKRAVMIVGGQVQEDPPPPLPEYADDRREISQYTPGYQRARKWEEYQSKQKFGWLLDSVYEAAIEMLPKYDAVQSVTEHYRVLRRLERLRAELATLPEGPSLTRSCLLSSRRAYAHGLVSFAVRAFGLPDEIVIRELVKPGLLRRDEVQEHLDEVRASGVIPPDVIGEELDREAEAVREREAKQERALRQLQEQQARAAIMEIET